jgi:uncharacterized membrane protein HdeD (DUF308 family)
MTATTGPSSRTERTSGRWFTDRGPVRGLGPRGERPVLVRAALGVVFGVLALAWPALTLRALVSGLGIYLAADGLAAIGAAIRHRPWSAIWFVEGLLGLGAALFVFFRPESTARAFVDLLAFWAMLTGLLEVAAAKRLRHRHASSTLVTVGAASLALGLSLFVWPEIAAVWLVRAVGVYALVFGLAMGVLAFWESRTSLVD